MVRGFSTKNPPVSLLHTFYWRLAPVTNCTYASHLVGLLTRLILQRRKLKTILINRFLWAFWGHPSRDRELQGINREYSTDSSAEVNRRTRSIRGTCVFAG